MALLAWNEDFSVGVKALDGQHAGLFKMVNDLHSGVMEEEAQSRTGDLLKKLLKYTQEHFFFEEKMMAATNYPGMSRHRTHHRDLTKQAEEFMARYERGDGSINIHLLRFLSDWLARHIQLEDKEYGPWLNRHGVS
jgi:hemerythrin